MTKFLRALAGTTALSVALVSPALAQDGAPATAVDPQAPPPADAAPDTGGKTTGDIIVTANPFGSETATIVAKVNRSAILATGGDSITDTLAGVPGISGTGFSPGANRPIIRGMDAARVRVLEDGLSASDVSDVGPDHGIPIDPLSAQSIEVVRGAGTLRYGSQAIGGVVNVINNRIPSALPAKALTGEISGAFDSVSDTGEGTALMDGRSGDIAVHADGFYRHADDYDTPRGRQDNSFWHGYGQNVGATWFLGGSNDSRIGASIQHYDAQYGIPADEAYIDMRQTKVATRSAFALGSGTLKALNIDGSYADYAHDEVDDGEIATTFKNKEVDGRAELLFNALGPVQNTALGGEIQHRKFAAIGEDSAYLSPTTTDTQAGYLFTDTPLGSAFRLQAAGRVEHVRVTGNPAPRPIGDDVTRDFTPVSGSIGVLYGIGSAIKLGLTGSSTGRAPLITELFARGGHDGPQTFETGDSNLRIERSNSLEATLRVNTGSVRFEGSVYSNWFKNYIYGQLTGRLCADETGECGSAADFPDGLKELFYRQQDAWFRGAEAEGHVSLVNTPTTTLELRALADYTRATFDDHTNVPRIPPYRVGGGADFRSDMFDAGVLFIHAGKQDQFGAFDTPTPGYDQLTAQVTARPFASYPGISLSVVGQNLTDDVQRNAAALNRDEVILPGRNIRAVLRIAFF